MKFRKRPVVIEAKKYTGTQRSVREIIDWANSFDVKDLIRYTEYAEGTVLTIRTLEGTMKAIPGDYIIRGVQGEFYPCKPEIFEATYEAE